jgi:hypothetical protein
MKRHRTVGTTEAAIERAETALGLTLPASFRRWLLENNGRGVAHAEVFPVLDDRDRRKTWDSIVRQFELWKSLLEDYGEEIPDRVLPFASFGTGDYYCFVLQCESSEEAPVYLWSHETCSLAFRAESFSAFVQRAESGEYEFD